MECCSTGIISKSSTGNLWILKQALGEAQWIKCDVRSFDMTVLGKFGVIMADPPWEIHQDLPYGTMADNEMRKMNIGVLQDNGVIFLWVTGAPLPFVSSVTGCRDIFGILSFKISGFCHMMIEHGSDTTHHSPSGSTQSGSPFRLRTQLRAKGHGAARSLD